MTTEKPLKRNENIQPLSREHHYGLLFCWKIRIGLNNGIDTERMIRYVDYFWKGHLQHHFKEEEELLFNQVNDVLCEQGKVEHVELETLINSLLGHTSVNEREDLLSLIVLLKAHIRYEERVLFPFFEENLSELQLTEIGQRLDKKVEDNFADNYGDEFWIIPK